MKVLHISNYYYPHIGGIEQVARDCVSSIGEDAEQRVFCFHSERGDARDEVDGIPVIRAGSFIKVASQSLSLSYGKLLKREMKDFAPDVVIFHFPNPFGAHYLLKCLKKSKAQLIVWWHLDITKQKLLKKFFRGQTLRLLRRADKIVATSPNYIEGSEFLPSFREKCTVIPNCAADSRVTLSDAEKARAEELKMQYRDKCLLFAVGRHVPYKGMEYLVRASKLLDDDYAVCIGGEGELTPSLKELAQGDEKVHFLGRLSDSELKAYLAAADIFCFPSITKNEAFGIALAEAMSFAKPSVTFTIEGSGVNYVSLNGVTGIEVPNGDVEAYAKAIETLKADKLLREKYGKAARAREQLLFTEAAFKDNVRKLLGLKEVRA